MSLTAVPAPTEAPIPRPEPPRSRPRRRVADRGLQLAAYLRAHPGEVVTRTRLQHELGWSPQVIVQTIYSLRMARRGERAQAGAGITVLEAGWSWRYDEPELVATSPAIAQPVAVAAVWDAGARALYSTAHMTGPAWEELEESVRQVWLGRADIVVRAWEEHRREQSELLLCW